MLWIQRSDERFFTGGTRSASWNYAQLVRYWWPNLRTPQILSRTFGVLQASAFVMGVDVFVYEFFLGSSYV